MNVLEIIAEYLKANGYDGLMNENDCACELDDLIPCGEDFSTCEPGYKIPCPKSCGEHEFHITNFKPESLTALEILNKVEPNGELLTTEIALKAMEEYAEQEAIRFAEWCISNRYQYQIGTGKWFSVSKNTPPKVITTSKLYQQFKKENP
jgi:hypothetical protein